MLHPRRPRVGPPLMIPLFELTDKYPHNSKQIYQVLTHFKTAFCRTMEGIEFLYQKAFNKKNKTHILSQFTKLYLTMYKNEKTFPSVRYFFAPYAPLHAHFFIPSSRKRRQSTQFTLVCFSPQLLSHHVHILVFPFSIFVCASPTTFFSYHKTPKG